MVGLEFRPELALELKSECNPEPQPKFAEVDSAGLDCRVSLLLRLYGRLLLGKRDHQD